MPKLMNETEDVCPGCNAVPGEQHTVIAQPNQRERPCPGDGRVDSEGRIIPEKRK